MDNANNLKVCRLCHEVINDHNFETLDDAKLEMLKIFSFDLNSAYTNKGSICSQCSDKLQLSFYFKTTCLDNNDYLKKFLHNDMLVLEEIIVREVSSQDKIKHKEKVCRFCLKYFDVELFTKLNEIQEDVLWKTMLEKCLPEIDINITKAPLMCQKCMDMLKNQFSFVISCLEVEERIKESSVDININNLDEAKEVDPTHVDLNNVKLEMETDDYVEYISDVDVKQEEISVDTEESEFQCKTEESLEINEELMCESFIKSEENLNTDLSFEEPISDSISNSEHPTFPEPEMLLENSDRMFVCKFCPYQTNRKDNLLTHFLKHKENTNEEVNMSEFKCSECDFVTKSGNSLKKHELVHVPQEDVKVFYCTKCSYKSIHKKNLRRHCERHMSIEPFQCQYCCFTTRSKHDFKLHNKTKHKKNIELMEEFRKCEKCNYVATNNRNLNNHMRTVHEVLKEKCKRVDHVCELCDFKTKQISVLQKHVLTHKNCNVVQMFNCSQCTFQTKYNSSMVKHRKRHESGWEPQRRKKQLG